VDFNSLRPEDGAMDKREAMQNTLYMAETGNDKDENEEMIQSGGGNGQNWTNGRIHKFTFTDPKDPTKATFEVMMDGNDPSAPGYNILKNPDNLDTSTKSLMINEDIIDANRLNATTTTTPYNITNNAKILRVDLENSSSNSITNDAGNILETIAYVNQLGDMAATHGDWESSGILDASRYFGQGSWLTDVQAHTLKEGGQLLLLKIPAS
jgi:hypothetical protein